MNLVNEQIHDNISWLIRKERPMDYCWRLHLHGHINYTFAHATIIGKVFGGTNGFNMGFNISILRRINYGWRGGNEIGE